MKSLACNLSALTFLFASGHGSTFVYEATDDSSAGADLMVANGSLSLTEVTLDIANANLGLSTWLVGNKLTLISYQGSITSGFTDYTDDTVSTGGIFGSNQWQFNYNDTSHGNNFTGDSPLDATSFVTFTVVPEPRAALLGSLGCLALLRRRRLKEAGTLFSLGQLRCAPVLRRPRRARTCLSTRATGR